MKKHLKRLGKWLTDNKIDDQTLIKLQDETQNLVYDENPLPYSRALLFLCNMICYSKYNHEMEKISQKSFTKVANLLEKCYSYLRELMNMKYISFTTEQNKAFNNERRTFRAIWHNAAKQFRESRVSEVQELPSSIVRLPSLHKRDSSGTRITIHSKLLGPSKKRSEIEREETEEDITRKRLAELVSITRMSYEE
jgi:hypothetical protein